MKLQIPDTSKGQKAMVSMKGRWYAIYYWNAKVKRRTLRTTCERDACIFRDQFFADLVRDNGATVRPGKTTLEKLADKPDLYIYKRSPFVVQIKGKVIAECATKREARLSRDKFLSKTKTKT